MAFLVSRVALVKKENNYEKDFVSDVGCEVFVSISKYIREVVSGRFCR